MEWLTGNVLWIVLGALFVWMHLKMHGGHHGHGRHGSPDHERHASPDHEGHGGGGHAGCCGGGPAPRRTPGDRSEPARRRHADAHGPRA